MRSDKFRIYLRRTFVNFCYLKTLMSLMYAETELLSNKRFS